MPRCKKIGEGVFGEVFVIAADGDSNARVLKIMPIEGDMAVNGEPQKTYEEIVSEMVITQWV